MPREKQGVTKLKVDSMQHLYQPSSSFAAAIAYFSGEQVVVIRDKAYGTARGKREILIFESIRHYKSWLSCGLVKLSPKIPKNQEA